MPHPGLLHPEPLPPQQSTVTRTSSADTHSSVSVSLGPRVLVHTRFEPSECLWQVWGLILNEISPLLEKEMAIHSSTIAWKIPWTGEPGRLQSMGVAKSRKRLSDFTFDFGPSCWGFSFALGWSGARAAATLALERL